MIQKITQNSFNKNNKTSFKSSNNNSILNPNLSNKDEYINHYTKRGVVIGLTAGPIIGAGLAYIYKLSVDKVGSWKTPAAIISAAIAGMTLLCTAIGNTGAKNNVQQLTVLNHLLKK